MARITDKESTVPDDKIIEFKNGRVRIYTENIPFLWIILLGILLILASTSFYIVDPGERYVEYNRLNGDLTDHGKGPHMKAPWPAGTVDVYNIRSQKDTAPAEAASEDQQPVDGVVTIRYHPDPTMLTTIHERIGTDYLNVVIKPAVQESAKTCTARFTYPELITQRPDVRSCIIEELEDRLRADNMILDEVVLENFLPPEEVRLKIVEKEAARHDLEAARFQANATITRARGEAESARIISDQLTDTPRYLTYLFIQRWNGALPSVMAGDNMGFLAGVNLQDLGNASLPGPNDPLIPTTQPAPFTQGSAEGVNSS